MLLPRSKRKKERERERECDLPQRDRQSTVIGKSMNDNTSRNQFLKETHLGEGIVYIDVTF